MGHAFAEGGCACGLVRYRLSRPPIFVHCCHCFSCQRETGSAFALNAMIETAEIGLSGDRPELTTTPSESGAGQKIMRCPHCRVAVWSHYSSLDELLAFVRVGTLDEPSLCPPDVHIFTASKQRWVTVPEGAPRFPEFYSDEDRARLFPQESYARRAALVAARG